MGNRTSKTEIKEGTKRREFSFSTLRKSKALRRKSLMPRSHLPIHLWLKHIDLLQYEHLFKKFSGVEELLYYDVDQIKELGVMTSSHCIRMVVSLEGLKDKYEKNQKLKLDINPRTSLVEGDEKEIRAKLHLEESQVLLREGSSCCRRSPDKRGGALISPDTIVKMSFQSDVHPAVIDEAEQKKLLEWELSLDSGDLRSHAWYHGAIPRRHAEELVQEEGQFLIRDCISQPGDYVLTCFGKGQPLHFVVQKFIVQANTIYEHYQYQLEGEAFNSIPNLITSYVGSKRAVTQCSGAVISTPMNRNSPLSVYVSRFVEEVKETRLHGTLSRPPKVQTRSSLSNEPKSVSSCIVRTHSPARLCETLPSSPHNRPSSESIPEGSSVMSRSIHSNIQFCSLPRKTSSGLTLPLQTEPPPKPSRKPSCKRADRVPSSQQVYEEIDDLEDATTPTVDAKSTSGELKSSDVYHPSGSDSGNGSGDSVQTTSSDSKYRNSRASFGDSGYNVSLDVFPVPELEPPSAFDLESFHTLLLPPIENRPLDATAFRGVRNTIMESGSKILATHFTRVDLDLLNGNEKQLALGVNMGIELITLPQGSQLRKDLIERTECMKLFVAVTILKEEDLKKRAEMIHQWIQIAIDTKTAMGNLYGFNAIMLGLCMPDILRLTTTWQTVRQKYTDSALSFESKLRSTLKSMNECSCSQAPNTVIPHILPFLLLCERDLEDIYTLHTKEGSLFQWESTASDHGLQMLLNHLQEGRKFCDNLSLYKRNADYVMKDVGRLEELTLDMFRTEFHLKFLFGSRAAFADSEDRVPMFQRVIATLSQHCEPL